MPSDRALLLGQAMLVAAREYRERIRTRAFLLSTLLTPLFLAAVFGGSYFMAMHGNAHQRLAVIADDPAQAAAAAGEIRSGGSHPASVEVLSPITPAALAALNSRVEGKDLNGYLVLRPRPGATTPEATYVSGSAADISSAEAISSALTRVTARAALTARGISAIEADRLLRKVPVATEQVRQGRAIVSDSATSFLGAYSLVTLLYVVVLIYGMNVARSVVQEKTSRIYEVLLSTARADSLMWGKLLGVGAVGLTQVAIWFALLGGLAGTSIAASYGVNGLSALGIRPGQVAFFLLFFVLGYLFYSGLGAAIGAFVGAEQELQQLSFIISAPLIVAVLMMNYVLSNPSSAVSVALSLVPPFTPILMYLRLCAQPPPAWQLALSILLLIAGIAGVVWFAARIYRVGILMYGKRPTLPEALRWLRAS